MVKTKAASYAPTVEQHEKAFQKQANVYVGTRASKSFGKGKLRATKHVRYVKSIGLAYKTPTAAIEGTYVDKKCPWTSGVTIRGSILKGKVISADKMTRTIVIRRDFMHYLKKYNRYEKRHSNLVAHCSPALRVRAGDFVEVGECRPLSKSVKFNVLKVVTAAEDKALSKFVKF